MLIGKSRAKNYFDIVMRFLCHTATLLGVAFLFILTSCNLASSRREKLEPFDEKRQMEAPLDYLTEEISDDPTDPELHFMQARLLKEKGNYRKALESVNRAIQLNQEESKYYMLQSGVYADAHNWKNALKAGLRAQALGHQEVELYELLAESEVELGNTAGANKFINTIIQLDPQNKKVLYLKGVNAYNALDTLQAIKHLERATKEDSGRTDAFEYLARIYLAQHKPEKAKENIEAGLRLNPSEGDLQFLFASYLREEGDLEGAKKAIQVLLGYNPDFVEAHYELAKLFASQRQYDSSAAHIEKILSINSNDISARMLAADNLFARRRLREAREAYEKIVELEPENLQAQEKLGQVKRSQRRIYLQRLAADSIAAQKAADSTQNLQQQPSNLPKPIIPNTPFIRPKAFPQRDFVPNPE